MVTLNGSTMLTYYPMMIEMKNIHFHLFIPDERSANQLQDTINCEFTRCGKTLYGDYQTYNTASKPITKADYNHGRSSCICTW